MRTMQEKTGYRKKNKITIFEETVEVFKIVSQKLGFSVIANSQKGDVYEMRLVLRNEAKQIPQEQKTEIMRE